MSISETVFGLFRPNPNPAAPNPSSIMDPMNPNNPANKPPIQQVQQPTLPNTAPQNPDPNNNNNQSPEVDLSKLWVNDPNVKGPADPAEFKFNIDQAKVDQTFGALDFTKAITPELMTKITAGGPEAASAMLSAMNTMVQQAVKTTLLASTKVTETGIQNSGQKMKDYLPSFVRENQVSTALREENPLMKKPEYAPMVEAVSTQISRQFPGATNEQIMAHTRTYFDNLVRDIAAGDGKQLVDVKQLAVAQGLVGQTDFSTWDK